MIGIDTVGRTVVLVHPPGPIEEPDWNRFLERMKRHDYDGLLVWTPGAAPNASQRNRVREVWGDQMPRLAVITDSAMVKGVISVLSLFMRDRIAGFLPNQLEGALAHAGVVPADTGAVRATLDRLRGEVGVAA